MRPTKSTGGIARAQPPANGSSPFRTKELTGRHCGSVVLNRSASPDALHPLRNFPPDYGPESLGGEVVWSIERWSITLERSRTTVRHCLAVVHCGSVVLNRSASPDALHPLRNFPPDYGPESLGGEVVWSIERWSITLERSRTNVRHCLAVVHCRSVVLNRSAPPDASRKLRNLSHTPAFRRRLRQAISPRASRIERSFVCVIDPERIQACSRGLSAATPPVTRAFSYPEGIKDSSCIPSGCVQRNPPGVSLALNPRLMAQVLSGQKSLTFGIVDLLSSTDQHRLTHCTR
ncbi:hypothetical protein VN12_18855 [Pirellula sp. SH-Sr6A]|nr:hypothetical protein VN12_18855 [Pirellula sp. SH-Sr6A]